MFGNRFDGFDFSAKSLLALCCGFTQQSAPNEKGKKTSGYDSSCDENDCIKDGLKKSTSVKSVRSASRADGADKKKKKHKKCKHKKKDDPDSPVVNG